MRSGSLRRSFAALGATVALVGGVLAATPADAAGTHTVTVTVSPAHEGWSVSLSCSPGSVQELATTNAAGQAFFPGVPDGSDCTAYAVPFGYLDPVLAAEASNSGYGSGQTTGSSTSPNLSVTMPPNTSFRCGGLGSISGTPAVGQQLTAVAPAMVNGTEDVAKRKVIWFRTAYRNGHIASQVAQGMLAADNNHYTVTEADLGWQMVGVILATQSGSTTTAICDWNPTGVVGRLGTPTSGRPGIAGKALVGKKLTANPHAVPPGTTVTYQWFRSVGGNGHKARLVKIRRAHGKRYLLRGADRGHQVFVAVTYSRSPFNPTTVLSGGKKVH